MKNKISLILIILSMMFCATSYAANFYDENGAFTGRSIKSGNTTKFYDENGHYTGHKQKDGNVVSFYDENGHYTGQERLDN